MNLLLFKTEDQLIQEGIARLDKTELNRAGSSGKVVRLLLNIVNSIIAGTDGVYESLRLNHANAFLSTASGLGLDSFGSIFNMARLSGEPDDDFRFRIGKITMGMATANELSIRLAALSVEGVQDVVLKEYSYGAGSYSLYIITESATTSTSILEAVNTKVNTVKAYGIKFNVVSPTVIDTEMNIVISLSPSTLEADKTLIETDIKGKVMKLINSQHMGANLVINDIINVAKSSNDLVKDAYISSLRLNGSAVFITDQTARWNQRFLVSTRVGAITIQGVV